MSAFEAGAEAAPEADEGGSAGISNSSNHINNTPAPPALPEEKAPSAAPEAAPSASAPPDPPQQQQQPSEPVDEAELLRNLVRNLETGETFDIRQFDEHVKEEYTLFPSRAELSAKLATPHSGDADSDDDSIGGKGGMGKISSKLSNALHFGGFRRRASIPQQNIEGHVRVTAVKKEAPDFPDLKMAQCIQAHDGPVWTLKFSLRGEYLASAGQSGVVMVWVVGAKSPLACEGKAMVDEVAEADGLVKLLNLVPLRRFADHTADVIDLSWNKENFLLSASIDKSVRLWHVARAECLHIFTHTDCVTSVDFHPKKDHQFVSGNFDKKLRIWNVQDGRVNQYASTPDMITAACFNPEGTQAVAGLYRGQVFFYQAEGMKYYTQVECRNRHGALRGGKKVTGLCYDTSRSASAEQLLITTNDSRLRLYQTEDYSMMCKYKGLVNDHMQIRATFSEDGAYVISGSENGNVYIWKATTSHSTGLAQTLTGFKKDRNVSYEFFNATELTPSNPPIVSVALFVPSSAVVLAAKGTAKEKGVRPDNSVNQMIIAADYAGKIRVFQRHALACS